ncbi:MAG: formylglycine-generating enzyme family protein, partial [Anaerolineales bacterium]|nr:formylglycine-generating enzyme family protein [Anaerolineales bacterium]
MKSGEIEMKRICILLFLLIISCNLFGQERITWKKDGSEMVLIPAGSFNMGDHFNEAEPRSLPVHKVTLDQFYIDTNEVTVSQFKAFVSESGYVPELIGYLKQLETLSFLTNDFDKFWHYVSIFSPHDNYPIIGVTWNDAKNYASWVGKRLPTEAEFEYTARGGIEGTRYPWGNDLSPDYANYSGVSGKDIWQKCSPIGSFEENRYGVNDISGNVWEWCEDWYSESYYSVSPQSNPSGPSLGSFKVIRGGSWLYDQDFLRVDRRCYGPSLLNSNNQLVNFTQINNHIKYDFVRIGFRCVIDTPKKDKFSAIPVDTVNIIAEETTIPANSASVT